MKKRIALFIALILLLSLLLAGCGGAVQPQEDSANAIEGLTFDHAMEVEYAQCFSVDYYQHGYVAIHVDDGRSYLVVPEGAEVPTGAADYIILQRPFDSIYLVATSTMCFFDSMDLLDHITLSGTEQEDWYIDGAAQAMAEGKMLYAGKYSAPDYELLVSKQCDLAIQSTMLYHTPEVQEKIEELGVPVLIDRSSYENHPLGRTEWIKVYGALMGCDDKAAELFDEQNAIVQSLSGMEPTDKTVAYFYVTSNGTVSVRKSADYLPTMIELAGGKYVFEDLGDSETATSGVTMTMEEFYATAKDADYILYNSTIAAPLNSVDELLEKSELFAEFKAVKEGNVWVAGKYLYQATDILGSMIRDIHLMLQDEADSPDLTFIKKLS